MKDEEWTIIYSMNRFLLLGDGRRCLLFVLFVEGLNSWGHAQMPGSSILQIVFSIPVVAKKRRAGSASSPRGFAAPVIASALCEAIFAGIASGRLRRPSQ